MAAPVRTDPTASEATFPIDESFTTGQPVNPHWKLRGTAKPTSGSDGCLQLTPDETDKAGTAYLDQPFSSKLGVSIEFDYACEGTAASYFGDGFCLYLIDGTKTTDTGAYGAALGYSRMGENSGTATPGVTAGYVGVGFDNYGNYASKLAGPDGPGRTPDMLGVRGSGNLRDGFRWLTGVKVPGGFRANWQRRAHVQITIIQGKLTVRHTFGSDPNAQPLIDSYDLTTAPGQAAMPATFKLGLSASTGGARAAHSIRNLHVTLPADLPLSMRGPAKAEVGERISYTITVKNNGPNDVPDAEVTGTLPGGLSDVTVTCEPPGLCGSGSTEHGLRQPMNLPKGGSAQITVSGTVSRAAAGGTLTATAQVSSPTRANTSTQSSATVDTRVPPIPAGGQVVAREGGTGWAQGGDPNTLVVTVDTSQAGFAQTPVYVVSVAGQKYVANLGAAGIHQASKDGFQVGLRWVDQSDLDVAEAERDGFRLDWIACPQGAEGVACGQTGADAWRQETAETRIVLVDVDTSHAGFTTTPVIVASVVGDQLTADLSTVAVVDPGVKGFTAAVRLSNQGNLSPGTAKSRGLRINWIACPETTTTLACGRTAPDTWRQGNDDRILFTDATTQRSDLPESPAFVATVAGGIKTAELCVPGIYAAKRTGFTAGVRLSDQAKLPPAFAGDNGIGVDWIACPVPPK
ncbi:lectin-like domain-containing protein [Streptomyces sp. CBMA156]|uniref:lectin-like domain-containing protein n=1 Tax=Streptomyces sp. CBMA156 TaxID=1930280 RepID=UPI001661C206|nr:DUF11 domain-containing protein [Streptomyces sp. CBMA156]MBD0672711.1 hypothetical protein [Streptomyces sp. CBMA156]